MYVDFKNTVLVSIEVETCKLNSFFKILTWKWKREQAKKLPSFNIWTKVVTIP